LHFDFKNAWKMLSKIADPALAGEAANPQNFNFEKLRKGRDSNPGNPFEFNTLAVCCFRPLSHLSKIFIKLCGSERIRTSGTLSGTTVFKTVAFNHSATLPYFDFVYDTS
jgi:hypothetical protein